MAPSRLGPIARVTFCLNRSLGILLLTGLAVCPANAVAPTVSNYGDLTVSGIGTQMSGANAAVTNSTGSTIAIAATTVAFTTAPAGSVSGAALTTQPVVTAQDAAGNTDVDFTETVTLTEASSGTLSNSNQTATGGIATFTSLAYAATADGQSFTLTANDQDGVGTNLTTSSASAINADVVATKMVFTAAPAGSISGTALTTQPVVAAQDANNITDTDFTETVTLS